MCRGRLIGPSSRVIYLHERYYRFVLNDNIVTKNKHEFVFSLILIHNPLPTPRDQSSNNCILLYIYRYHLHASAAPTVTVINYISQCILYTGTRLFDKLDNEIISRVSFEN